MMAARALSPLFLPHLPDALRARAPKPDELEPLLAEVLSCATEGWTDVVVDPATFLRYVAERLPDQEAVDDALRKLRLGDLYLVCACLEGDSRAEAILERDYLPEAAKAVARMKSSSAQPDDIRQILYQKLLVADGDQPPKLVRYAGRGDLRSWLRVTAVRAALDLVRADRKERPLDDNALLELTSPEEDQELAYLKRLYRQEFKAAFQRSLDALSSRERNILRLQLLDGLNIDQVGAIYKVHRATIARWNTKVREKLLSTTRRELLSRLNIGHNEFESIMRLIGSQFDVSLCRQLDDSRDRR